MTEVELCRAIRERLKVSLKDIYHPTDPGRDREQEFKAPEIINGFLPPKRDQLHEPEFPFVIVRPSEWETEVDSGNIQDTLKVKLLVGSYGKDYEDHEYALVIMRRMLTDLRMKPMLKNAAGEDTWKMRPQIKGKLPDEQATTVFFIELVTEWELPTPQDHLEDDGYAI